MLCWTSLVQGLRRCLTLLLIPDLCLADVHLESTLTMRAVLICLPTVCLYLPVKNTLIIPEMAKCEQVPVSDYHRPSAAVNDSDDLEPTYL